MDRDEWNAQFGEQLVAEWKRWRPLFGEEICQQTALKVCEKMPSSPQDLGALFYTVAKRWKMAGFRDGRRNTGPTAVHGHYDERDTSAYPTDPNTGAILEDYLGALPSPEDQVIARDLLRKADPRLVLGAFLADGDGMVTHKGTGVSRQSMSNFRQAFYQRVGGARQRVDARGRGKRWVEGDQKRARFCARGHDKMEVGVYSRGECRACRIERAKQQAQVKRG